MRISKPVFTVIILLLAFAAMPSGTAAQERCVDFASQMEAMEALNDSNRDELDADGDGLPCESLPFEAEGGDESTSQTPGEDEDASLCTVEPGELEIASEDETPTQESATLEGRLGGSADSFEDQYFVDGEFQQEGCSPMSNIGSRPAGDGSSDVVAYIDLWADRPDDLADGTVLTEPDEGNWTLEEAFAIVNQLLPADTELQAEYSTTDAGNMLYYGYSDTLAANTTLEHYAYYESPYGPGELEVLLFPSTDGEIWSIVVKIAGAN